MPVPLPTSHARDVQAENRDRAQNDHARDDVHPIADKSGEEDGRRPCAKVESELESDARNDDVGGPADGEPMRFNAPPFGWGRVLRLLRLPTWSCFPARPGRRTLRGRIVSARVASHGRRPPDNVVRCRRDLDDPGSLAGRPQSGRCVCRACLIRSNEGAGQADERGKHDRAQYPS